MVIAAGAVSIEAQPRKFRWTTELCEFEGTYDARKYTLEQLKDTAALVADKGLPLQADATVWKYADIDALSVEALDREYREKAARLKALKLVAAPEFEALRAARLRELEEHYRLSRTTMLAYRTPAVIKDYRGADSCVARYAAPLAEGGDALLAVWRTVNEEGRRRNASPERIEARFNEQLNSPARLEFALVEVMSFGWWNCANEFVERVADDGRSEARFKKLFSKVRTVYCDEP